MYTITCDEYILSDPRHEDLIVDSPKLNLEVNKNGSLEFTIYPSHPYYDRLNKLKSIVTVYQDNKAIFKGRIIDDELGFYNEKHVTVEGILGFLLDSIQEPFEYQGSVADLFVQFINNHNSQVDSFQKFRIGNITVVDPNDYINRSSTDYLTTKEAIESRLLETCGGYLNIRYEREGNYIDYLVDFEDTSTQIIEFGENLIDLTQKIDAINIKTGIIPLGAKLKDSEGKDTNQRLTIESVNGGIKYLLDSEMAEQYGKIFQVVIYDDITEAPNLLTRGQQELAESVKLSNTIELTAVDLNNVDKNIESFHFCDYIRILSSPHGIDKTYLLQKLNIDIANPQNTKITLGETIKTLTDTTVSAGKTSNSLIQKVDTIYSDYVTNENIANIIDENLENSSVIQQTSEDILMTVSEQYTKRDELEEYKQTLSTQLSQTSDDWTFKFTEIVQQLTNIDGTINNNYNELIKYIRFVDGSIILGEVGNEMTLKIQNDRISFLQNNVEVAYMSNGKLYITDGEFISSLTIGKFGFLPRMNGNLSFKKVRN